MEEKLWVSAAAISDKGCHRDNNEDNFDLNGVVMPLEKMDAGAKLKCSVPLEHDQLYAVCDGMGGEEAGEVASYTSALTMSRLPVNIRFAVRTIKSFTSSSTNVEALPRSFRLLKYTVNVHSLSLTSSERSMV